ncbi:hypothetical protein TNCV_1823811 [Trichonephila clavipes]|nr:hypothetical protein TNCV_1823811 [Trichonephila clavipes]
MSSGIVIKIILNDLKLKQVFKPKVRLLVKKETELLLKEKEIVENYYQLSTSSVGYSSSPVHWSSALEHGHRTSRPRQQLGQSSGRASRKSHVRWLKLVRASALSRCLRIGPTLARVYHGFPSKSSRATVTTPSGTRCRGLAAPVVDSL